MRLVLFILVILFAVSCIAQDSLSYYSNPVVITDLKIQNDLELKKETTLTEDAVHIQTNGPDQLATILHRGQGARHLAILWNGWNLQSPLNGTLDFNLIPNAFYNTELIQDNAKVILGSASQAGAVILQEVKSPKSVSVGYDYSTLSNHGLSGRYNLKRSKLSWTNKFSYVDNQNRFSYNSGSQRLQREHNHRSAIDLASMLKWELSKTQHLDFDIWYQNSGREIAPSTTTVYDGSRLEDDNLRVHGQWNLQKGAHQWSIRAAYLSEGIFYDSDLIKQSDTRSQSYRSEFIHSTAFKRLKLTSGVDLQDTRANYTFDSFTNNANTFDVNRQQMALWNALTYTLADRWNFRTHVRVENFSDHRPLMYYSGMLEYNWQDITLTYGFSRHYQLPNFNDLYWPTGGNENLDVEQGYQHELTGKWSSPIGRFALNTFSIQGKDWIVWAPNSFGMWSPENRRSVWSRGLELSHKLRKNIAHQFVVEHTIEYVWTHSTLRNEADASLNGKQLIYIPRHVWSSQLKLHYKNSKFEINNRYTSKRFSTSDNSVSIDAFMVTDLGLYRKIEYRDTNINLVVLVQNMLNAEYEIVNFYPSPLRNYSFGVQIEF